MPDLIADIAVNAPLKQLFSYRVSASDSDALQVGMRVRIPFGRRQGVGTVLSLRQGDGHGLKEIKSVLDDAPLLPEGLIRVARVRLARFVPS